MCVCTDRGKIDREAVSNRGLTRLSQQLAYASGLSAHIEETQ